jgi:hypothetical protein
MLCPNQARDAMTLTIWPELAALKIRPNTLAPQPAGTTVAAKGARGEGTCVQVVLRSDVAEAGVTPSVTAFVGPGGASLAPGTLTLYRVDYINVTAVSDAAGALGEWPDPLVPIGQPFNGAPFSLTAGRTQPVWLDFRIPRATLPGDYAATFELRDAGGALLGSMPLRLTVWNIDLPPTSSLPTSYGFSRGAAFAIHYPGFPIQSNNTLADQLTQRYQAEAAAHRITLDVVDAWVGGQPPALDWTEWDPFVSAPGASSFLVPWPPGIPADPRTWSAAQTQMARNFWATAGQHYATRGWLAQSYLYTKDEPQAADYPINIGQSQNVHQADPRLRSLVTHEYDAGLAAGNFDIWVPNITQFDPAQAGSLAAAYQNEQANGKDVWWYDSNNSNFPDPINQQYGKWPDEFIDHHGVNQLVHGPVTWKYRLDGYLYYNTIQAYEAQNPDPWHQLYFFGTNGDGTLFYPGRASIIGGSSELPLPSIRMQLLRTSWTIYDELVMLRDRGRGADADAVANALVTAGAAWSVDPVVYENARQSLATLLAAVPTSSVITDRSTFSESEVGATGTTDIVQAFYVVIEGVMPAQLGMTTLPTTQSERDAVSPQVTFTRTAGPVPQMTAFADMVLVEGPGFDPYANQRVTFRYTVRFSGTAGFYDQARVGIEYQDVTATARATAISGLSATGQFALIRQPNPYMLDGVTSWLSNDVRVFQVSQGTPPPITTNASVPTDKASAITFIQTVLGELDSNPPRFESIATGYDQSWLELSPTRQQRPVFNFAVARVRYAGLMVDAPDVRVFFRLFTTAATGLDYHVNLNYRRSAPDGPAAPLLGATQNGQLTTIPFFAVQRIDDVTHSMVDQIQNDIQGVTVKTLPASQGAERQLFFGAWLDINQPNDARFPSNPPSDGPWLASSLMSIQSLIRGRHQCIVAEVYFLPTATAGDRTPEGATPASSENLAQRNLAIVESANPGTAASRTVQHTFVIHRSPQWRPLLGADARARVESWFGPEELLITWEGVPPGTTAQLMFGGIDVDTVLDLVAARGERSALHKVDDATLRCDVGGMTWVPLAAGTDAIPALLTIELPAGVTHGEVYRVLVQQKSVANRIVGSFGIAIPVRPAPDLVAEEANSLAVFRYIESLLAEDDGWLPVMHRYVQQMAARVRGLGGDPERVRPSPYGTDVPRARGCLLSIFRLFKMLIR